MFVSYNCTYHLTGRIIMDVNKEIRSFIAFEIPNNIKEKISLLQTNLSKKIKDVRWVKSSGIHLTIKFLGNIQENKINLICEKISSVMIKYPPFEVIIKEIGCFPNFRKPRVIWLGLEEKRNYLLQISNEIETELKQIGFPPEDREFSPHLTLGRFGLNKVIADFAKIAEDYKDLKIDVLQLASISLIKSDLKSGGAIYTTIGSFPLMGNIS